VIKHAKMGELEGSSPVEGGSESMKTRCQRLQDECLAAEMECLSTSYGVADVDTVSAWGHKTTVLC